MYCIDGVCTLKNCKPTLIHWVVSRSSGIGHFMSKNRVKTKNAENKLSKLATDFKAYLGNAVGTSSQLAFATC